MFLWLLNLSYPEKLYQFTLWPAVFERTNLGKLYLNNSLSGLYPVPENTLTKKKFKRAALLFHTGIVVFRICYRVFFSAIVQGPCHSAPCTCDSWLQGLVISPDHCLWEFIYSYRSAVTTRGCYLNLHIQLSSFTRALVPFLSLPEQTDSLWLQQILLKKQSFA